MLHTIASFFGTFIGGVTATGSLAAFRKLANMYPKDKMNLPYAGQLNKPIIALNVACVAAMLTSPGSIASLLALWVAASSSSVLGWNITNNIGSADMPVNFIYIIY